METSQAANENVAEPTEKFYLPAVTLPPKLSRVEAFVEEVFDLHGVVLIPDSYNN